MKDKVSKGRRLLAGVLIPLYMALILGAPLTCLAFGSTLALSGEIIGAAGAFALTVLAHPFVAGILSLPHQRHMIEGRMPLDTGLHAYFHRRLYGLCWTSVYYSGPIYYTLLGIPALRTGLFRLFGYRGGMAFTIYPDTWVRDLPLLDFGDGSYLSNKATIGSNMIFIRNGKKEIEIGRIKVGKNAMVGHMTMIGPYVEIGDDAQIGVGCGIGRKVKIGARAVIGDTVVLDHGAKVEACSIVPTRSYVGMGRRVTADEELATASVNFRRGRATLD